MTDRLTSTKTTFVGLVAAFGIAAITVGGSVFLSIQPGSRIDLAEEWGVLLFNIVWVAAPFCALALAQVRAMRAWIVGVIATLLFWSAYLNSASQGGGANIGMALLMLISPLIVAAAAFGAYAARSRT